MARTSLLPASLFCLIHFLAIRRRKRGRYPKRLGGGLCRVGRKTQDGIGREDRGDPEGMAAATGAGVSEETVKRYRGGAEDLGRGGAAEEGDREKEKPWRAAARITWPRGQQSRGAGSVPSARGLVEERGRNTAARDRAGGGSGHHQRCRRGQGAVGKRARKPGTYWSRDLVPRACLPRTKCRGTEVDNCG